MNSPSSVLRCLFLLIFGVSVSVSFVSLFGKWWFVFDLLTSLTPLVGGLVLVRGAHLIWSYRGALRLTIGGVLLLASVCNGWLMLPAWQNVAREAEEALGTTGLRVATVNVSESSEGYDRLVSELIRLDADVIYLSEVRPDLVQRFESDEVKAVYPHQLAVPSRQTLGIAFLSKRELIDPTVVPFDESAPRSRRYLRATISYNDQLVDLVSRHPLPPTRADWAASRNAEILSLAQTVESQTRPLVVLGDFNATPWSYPMREILKTTSLQMAAPRSALFFPTWNLIPYLDLVALPIDHVLVTPEWQLRSFRQIEGETIGSDHDMVVVHLDL